MVKIKILTGIIILLTSKLFSQQEENLRNHIDTLDFMDRWVDAFTRVIYEVKDISPKSTLSQFRTGKSVYVFFTSGDDYEAMKKVLRSKFNCQTEFQTVKDTLFANFKSNATDSISISTIVMKYGKLVSGSLDNLNGIGRVKYLAALYTYINNYHNYLEKIRYLFTNVYDDNNFNVNLLTHYYQAKQLLLNSKNGLYNAINFEMLHDGTKKTSDSLSRFNKIAFIDMKAVKDSINNQSSDIKEIKQKVTDLNNRKKGLDIAGVVLGSISVLLLTVIITMHR